MRRWPGCFAGAAAIAVASLAAAFFVSVAKAAPRDEAPTLPDQTIQFRLEGDLAGFDRAQEEADGNTDAEGAYDEAAKLDGELKMSYATMQTELQGMSTDDANAAALIADRVAQATAELALFFATLPEVESGLAAEAALKSAPAVVKAAVGARDKIVAVAKIVGQIQNDYTAGKLDVGDALLNELGTANSFLAASEASLKESMSTLEGGIGNPIFGLLGQVIGAAKTVKEIGDDIEAKNNLHNAHQLAYVEASENYQKLLGRLNAAVKQMQSAVQAGTTTTTTTAGTTTTSTTTGPGSQKHRGCRHQHKYGHHYCHRSPPPAPTG